ncbi:hypothetical protein EDC04DRAFT_2715312 [Pisolithus marmoratus]|nr:hypothetical protein EDC04DRAFT_2715312 [Pisolithus marmoratus]
MAHPDPSSQPCRFYLAGRCNRGSSCGFSHGVCRYWQAGNRCKRGDSCWYLYADNGPTDPRAAEKEAAETMGRVVQGSIVTYGAGLDIVDLTTGFESCTLRVRNIPPDAKEDYIHALVSQQGVDPNRYYFVGVKKAGGGKVEAEIMTDEQLGWDLFEICQDNGLDVDVLAPNTLEGMAASSPQNAATLTLSWRCSAVQYAVKYMDAAAAQAKVRELNGRNFKNHCIKARMNEASNRTHVRLGLGTILIRNFPPGTGDAEVVNFSGSNSVKRLENTPSLSVGEVGDHLRNVISRIAPGSIRSLDRSSTPDRNDNALAVRKSLKDSKYGTDAGMWLRVPPPMDFTISLDQEQYTAQKTQWDALMDSVEDPQACRLNMYRYESTVRIRLSGSQNHALGALKVKVEDLARGQIVQGWHRDLAKSKFPKKVYIETGAYMRVDWKTQTIKVYGSAAMIDEELARLSSMDDPVPIPPQAIRSLIVGGGLAQLKEKFGEERSEARQLLNNIMQGVVRNDQGPLAASGSETACPVCLGDISVPFHLGCGHAYCVVTLTSYLAKHPTQFKYCKTPGCVQIYRSTGPDARMTLRCPSCFSDRCAEVRRRHAEEDRQNEAWIAAQGQRIKRCPQCNVLIEKLDGCNHVECRCGAHICWRCLGIFTRNTIYQHMNEAHQGYYTNERALEDIPEQRRPRQQIQHDRERGEQQQCGCCLIM